MGTTSDQTIVLDRVDTNLVEGYNGTTRVFTAPVAFEMYYPGTHFSSYGRLQLMKNNQYKIRVVEKLDNEANVGTIS